MYYKSLIGKKINSWTVLGIGEKADGSSRTRMICRCDCGTVKEIDTYSLTHNGTKSCGKCNVYVDEGDHIRCIMKSGASFIFDKEDLEKVKAHTWSIANGHVRCVVNGKNCYAHRIILGEKCGMEVDHKNQDKTDNRKCNLRYASHAENQRNRDLRADNTTGYKGVCFDKRSKLFIAYINTNNKRTYLGYFKKAEEAARAYDTAAKEQHGEFAWLNFPEEKAS